jgi:ferredoxin
MQNQTVNTVSVSDNTLEQQDKKASDYSDYKFELGVFTKITKPESTVEEISTENTATMPTLPVSEAASDTEALLYRLRHFHLGNPDAITETVGDDYVPALLHAYRNGSKVRYDYPLFLYPTESIDANAEQLAKPISLVLLEWVESFAPNADAARILKDNLHRIERELRQKLKEIEGPTEAFPLLSEAGKALQNDLELGEDNNARLQADFDKLLELIPAESQLLGYGRYAAIHLLNHVIRSRLLPRRARFHETIKQHIRGLKKLLEVEWGKSDESTEPRMVRDSVGTAGTRFDPNALSEVMGHSRGSVSMSSERHERIEKALQTLQEYLQSEDPVFVRIIHTDELTGDWLENTPTLEAFSEQEPCNKATTVFDQQVAKWAKIFGAARIAQLEMDNIYDPSIHDPWFANFTWEAFSKEEILLLPAVIAIESANRAAGESMNALSRLLSSGRPVHILVRVRSHSNPHILPDEDPFLNYRFELGYFGISHRQAVVSQSSAARHLHLLTQFLSAQDATRTCLHIVNTAVQHSVYGINAWLVAGAALESRAHPFFCINPEAGDSSADRMDFTGNPEPEMDWPVHPFQYQNEKGEIITMELAFTFADYALLVPHIRQYFRLVPTGYDSEALIPIEAYLSASPEKTCCKKIPFIWAVNSEGELRKLVVSRALILASWDRLNYWHTLQEQAGINNKYVYKAVEKAREEIQAEEQAARERLEAEYGEKLEQVRSETASDVMQRLTDVLLGLDVTGSSQFRKSITPASSTPSPTKEPEAEKEAEKEVEKEAEEEEVVFDDPWIDSDLCTSCNDCLNINTMLFVYNESKQAVLGDLNSGTYAQLVEGAEVCPVDCIHPGKPRNPDEPGLEELIKRAEPFNKL